MSPILLNIWIVLGGSTLVSAEKPVEQDVLDATD
jgi:hypothetical protein